MSNTKHGFFLPLLFIGMGIGFILQQYMGGSVFVASMFIGMGLGFFLDSFLVVEGNKLHPRSFKNSRITLSILGILFIFVGLISIINPALLEHLWNYLIAIGFILFGLYLLLRGWEKKIE